MHQIAKNILSLAVIVKSEVSATNMRQRTSITEAIISKRMPLLFTKNAIAVNTSLNATITTIKKSSSPPELSN